MRILQLNTYADPVGGAEVYMLSLADELERRGHVVGRFGVSSARDHMAEGWHVVHRPDFRPDRTFRDPELTGALRAFLARLEPDIVHVHNLHSLPIGLLELLSSVRAPIVQTVHDYSSMCPNTWCVLPDGTPCEGGAGAKCFTNDCSRNYPFDAAAVLATMIRHRLVRAFTEVSISPSLYLAETLRRHGYRDVRHVFYFVDAERVAAPTAPRETRTLLYLGRLEPEKGVEVLLDALPGILAEEPGVRVSIVGAGSVRESLEERARSLGLAEAVTFHGKVPHDEVLRFYATATAQVLPSIWTENSPLTAYESLLAGLPVIGSRIGGIPDLIEDGRTGFLFRPRDSADLREKVLSLLRLSDEARAALSARSRELGAAFTRERNVDAVEAIYAEVLERGRTAEPATLPVGPDLVDALHHLGGDVGRLDALFREHTAYIGGLEQRYRELEAEYHRLHADPVRSEYGKLERVYDSLRAEYERLLTEYRRQTAYVDELEAHVEHQTGYVDELERAHRALGRSTPPPRFESRLRGRTVRAVRDLARALRLPKIFH